MKQLIILALFSCLVTSIAFADDQVTQEQNEANSVLDNYIEAKAALLSSRWAYLGCTGSKDICSSRAQARGYTETKTTPLCGPRNQYPYSCWAR